jgi:pyridoxine 5-phosphate synthase
MTPGKVRLSVNINKIALIRNSRGGNMPDLVQMALACESFGAEGITIHPRPDQRHIRYDDIPALREVISTELNIEGNPTDAFMEQILTHKPHQCTLVPDSPEALTSDKGWDTITEKAFVSDAIRALKKAGIRVSLFVDAEPRMVEGAAQVNADRVEFYTGRYAAQFKADPAKAVRDHIEAAKKAAELQIGVNAGHDLNLDNLRYYITQVPGVLEVSIGHAIVCDSLWFGLSNVIGMYRYQLRSS